MKQSLISKLRNLREGVLRNRLLRKGEGGSWLLGSHLAWWKKALIVTSALGLLTGVSGAIFLYAWLKQTGVTHLDQSRLNVIIDYKHADNSIVYDRKGEKIGEFFSDYHVFIPFEKLPPRLIQAVMAVEDRHFYEHRGIDLRGIARALLASLRTGGFTQGGSTITQQVVRNFLLSPEKKLERKIKEALLSLQLERHLSKEKILEIYLNALFLGQGSYGAGAAAERHFGKPLEQLELHELALIAGLFQSPSRYNPHRFPALARRRQQQVLKAMLRAGFISKAEYKKAQKLPLRFQGSSSLNAAFAPHFIDAVQEQVERLLTSDVKGKGLRIYTSLDLGLQKSVNETFQQAKDHFRLAARKLADPKQADERQIEAAALILDQKSGEVLAMVGGRDFARSQFNRTLKAKRSPGSAFKPVVYAQALLSGLKWSDMTLVSPVAIQDYRPQNTAGEFLTEVTYYNAFYRSLNTPLVELGHRLGSKNVLDLARRMGVQTELKKQAGTFLGGSELTLMDMASVYATIANYGVYREPRFITKISDREGKVLWEAPPLPEKPERVLPEATAYLLIDALQAVFRQGTASQFAEFGAQLAGKTGTSNEAKDNWFCGMSDKITAVLWLGTDGNLPFTGTAGGNTLALPLWVKMMQKAQSRYPFAPFPVPTGIVRHSVQPFFGYKSEQGGIMMPFIEGREPDRTESSFAIVRDHGNYRDYLDR